MPSSSLWRLGAVFAAGLASACSTTDALTPGGSYSAIDPGPKTSVALTSPRFGDSKPVTWTYGPPHSYEVHGTDVSKYQRSVNWQAAKASGISFAFVKATEGGDRVDSMFAEHMAGTKAAGIPRSAYHFYYFCRPAEEQAAWYIQNVPRERGAMPPVLDMEWNPDSPSCKLRPPPATVRSEMKKFLTIIERHYGKKPIVYTSIDFFDDNNLSTFHGYHYWLRSVASHPSARYGSHPFHFWQYTGTGIVPGINGNADINVFNGSHSQWKTWLAKNTK